jgi:hypothetical protein
MECIEQTLNGSVSAGSRVTATISRNGDLISSSFVELTSANGQTDVANFGAAAFDNIELEIGGQRIDKHHSDWLEAWAELTQPNPSCIVGTGGDADGTLFQNMSGMGGVAVDGNSAAVVKRVPLQFWFNRNPGLALPLIALQYHEVKIIMNFSSVAGTGTNFAAKLWVDYIYLDTDERRRFAQQSHEYLIEQVQRQTLTAAATSHDLNFNHPVKELVWTGAVTNGATFAALTASINYTLKLNGHDRFAAQDVRYFSEMQVYQHHTGQSLSQTAGTGGKFGGARIAVYSFALKPEEHQPSGTCNFSRIDNAQLTTSAAPAIGNIYAVNYNVLRIMSGMGGLAYSN